MTSKIKPPFSFSDNHWAIKDSEGSSILRMPQNNDNMLTEEECDDFLRWVTRTLNKDAENIDSLNTSGMEIIGGEITVDFDVSTDIHDAFIMCKKIIYAKARMVTVKFNFNSVLCKVSFNSDWNKFNQQYESALHQEVDGL